MIARILRQTCMACGHTQRLKVDVDTEDTSGCECYSCGRKGNWMALPTLHAPPPKRPLSIFTQMFGGHPAMQYRWYAEEDDE